MKRALTRLTLFAAAAAAIAAASTAVPAAAQVSSPAAAPARAATGEWRQVGLPFLWPSAGLIDVSAAGPSDVWVAGLQGAFCIPQIASWGCYAKSDGNPVVRRWNGSGWQEYPLPGWSGNGLMTAVGTAAPDDVWVSSLGYYEQEKYLAHFDGSAFTEIQPPMPNTPYRVFSGAAGTWLSSGSGVSSLYRWTGGGWQDAEGTGLGYAVDVRARTATDAWAVGRGEDGKAGAAHWDGQSWQPVGYPADDHTLHRVLPISANDVWVSVENASYVTHWDGSAWSQVDLPSGVASVKLAVDGSGTVWAGGYEFVTVNGYSKRRPVLLSRVGGTWRRTPVSMPWGADEMEVAALATVPGTGALWLVGNSSTGPVVLTKD
ncbi:hypothetical protein [Actinomadura monticuli]|uniref:Secreted protein n=1 Tax=Actinomadura monticuli TaxID=3097367 RepID=A0ABV4Q354_9ACTN